METSTEITVQAPAETVFALAAATEEWARILPHYHSVRRLRGDDEHKVVAMRAWRAFGPARWPVRWTAVQRTFADDRRITFVHVRGISRGMAVEWRLTETPAGTHVRIWHDFHSHLPVIGRFFAHRIVGQLFVTNIATKTLRRIKHLAEQQAQGPGTAKTPRRRQDSPRNS